jgi:hypothetical protein
MSARNIAGRGEAVDARSNEADEPLRQVLTGLDAAVRSFDVAGRMERQPYIMIAAAVSVGFVLGGGLFRPFASRLIRAGLRLALIPLAQQAIVRLLSPAIESDTGEAPVADGTGRPT